MREEGGAADLRKGCLSSSLAVALCSGCRTSIFSRKSSSSGEAWRGGNGVECLFVELRTQSESQEEQNGASFSFIAPSSEET